MMIWAKIDEFLMSAELHGDFLKIIWGPRKIGLYSKPYCIKPQYISREQQTYMWENSCLCIARWLPTNILALCELVATDLTLQDHIYATWIGI